MRFDHVRLGRVRLDYLRLDPVTQLVLQIDLVFKTSTFIGWLQCTDLAVSLAGL